MIGNDLVDLRAKKSVPPERLSRMRAKVLRAEEAKLLDRHFDFRVAYFVAWAAKEAVYKLEYKRLPRRYFHPRAITCREISPAGKDFAFQLQVQGKWGVYPVYLQHSPTHLEAIALARRVWLPYLRRYAGVRSDRRPWSQVDTRDSLFQMLDPDFSVEQLHYERTPFPQLFYRKKELPLSISHDGDRLSLALLDLPARPRSGFK